MKVSNTKKIIYKQIKTKYQQKSFEKIQSKIFTLETRLKPNQHNSSFNIGMHTLPNARGLSWGMEDALHLLYTIALIRSFTWNNINFLRTTLPGGHQRRKCHLVSSLVTLSRHFQTSFHNDQLLPKMAIAHLKPIPGLAWLELLPTAIKLEIQFLSIQNPCPFIIQLLRIVRIIVLALWIILSNICLNCSKWLDTFSPSLVTCFPT